MASRARLPCLRRGWAARTVSKLPACNLVRGAPLRDRWGPEKGNRSRSPAATTTRHRSAGPSPATGGRRSQTWLPLRRAHTAPPAAAGQVGIMAPAQPLLRHRHFRATIRSRADHSPAPRRSQAKRLTAQHPITTSLHFSRGAAQIPRTESLPDRAFDAGDSGGSSSSSQGGGWIQENCFMPHFRPPALAWTGGRQGRVKRSWL